RVPLRRFLRSLAPERLSLLFAQVVADLQKLLILPGIRQRRLRQNLLRESERLFEVEVAAIEVKVCHNRCYRGPVPYDSTERRREKGRLTDTSDAPEKVGFTLRCCRFW